MPSAPPPPVLLVHGAAVTSRCWAEVAASLVRRGFAVRAPDRPSTGDLAAEVEALADDAEGALVVGVSGGATLGMALAASPVVLAGAVLHEPAVGSLLPGLLAAVAQAHARGGTPAFGAALHGPAWTPSMAPGDPGAVTRDLAMFRAFEPVAPRPGQGPVLVTVGELSPPVRHDAAAALAARFGVEVSVLPGCRHFVPVEAPEVLVALVVARAAALAEPR